MMRRLMTIVIMLLMLSSCYYFNQVVDDIKESNKISKTRRKDGDNAYQNDKYKEGTYEAIKDVSKRPVNIKIQFEDISLSIIDEYESVLQLVYGDYMTPPPKADRVPTHGSTEIEVYE